MCGMDPRDEQVTELEIERDTALSVVEDMTKQITEMAAEKRRMEQDLAYWENKADVLALRVGKLEDVLYLAEAFITDPRIVKQVRRLYE